MIEYFNLSGINTYLNPMLGQDGQLIHGVNIQNFPAGAISKRPGYNTFLGAPDTGTVNSLLYYPDWSGTLMYLYRASGSSLYNSLNGTGAWTLSGNGTITNGNHVQGAILLNTFIIADGAGSVRHTTNGTSFTNTSGAPISQYLAQFHNHIYASNGTNSTLTTSTGGDATNWAVGGTSDATSYNIQDEGAVTNLINVGDRLVICKNKGKMFNFDDYAFVDMTTKYGPTMPWSIGNIDDYWFLPNAYGIFGFDGANKQLLSNPIQRQFYNRAGNGMGTAQIGPTSSACGAGHIWDYFMTQGTITDDFTGRQISNAILKYDYQKNTFLNWQFNDTPTAMLSYTDANNQKQLIFGNNAGQVFQLSSTATSDNGKPIATDMVFCFTYAAQQQQFSQTSATTVSGMSYEKKWNFLRIYLNPGCEINVQYAFSNTFTYQHLRFSDPIATTNLVASGIATFADGVLEIRFSNDLNNLPRSRILFVRLYDDSDNSAFTLYGMSIDAEIQIIK